MDDVHAHSVADCNGVSGDSLGQGMSRTDAFTHIDTNTCIPKVLLPSIVGVLVQIQTMEYIYIQ